MARLTEEQLRFLTKQGIPLSRVFDATGMAHKQWKEEMKAQELDVAFGVTPCGKGGHTLRTRFNHCLQCGTHNLAFFKRYDNPGHVYVASSKRLSLVKIGTASDVGRRISMLNSAGYGGGNDWDLYFSRECTKAGRVEFIAQSKVQASRSIRTYMKNGVSVDCQELFACLASTAIDAVQAAIVEVEGIPTGTASSSAKAKHPRRRTAIRPEEPESQKHDSEKRYREVIRVPVKGFPNNPPNGGTRAPRKDHTSKEHAANRRTQPASQATAPDRDSQTTHQGTTAASAVNAAHRSDPGSSDSSNTWQVGWILLAIIIALGVISKVARVGPALDAMNKFEQRQSPEPAGKGPH